MRSKVRERVGTLVAVVFGGNERAAAIEIGVAQSTMHRILNADIEQPSLATLGKISTSLSIPIGWILGETDRLPSEPNVDPGPNNLRQKAIMLLAFYVPRVKKLAKEIKEYRRNAPEKIRSLVKACLLEDRDRVLVALLEEVDYDYNRLPPDVLDYLRADHKARLARFVLVRDHLRQRSSSGFQ